MLQKKAKVLGRPKMWVLLMAMMVLLGFAGSAAAAPEIDASPHTAFPAAGYEQDRLWAAERLASPSIYIMHYDRNGNPTGRLHQLTIDEYYAILDALIASGHDPSPQNIDCMGHRMRGEDCPLDPPPFP